MTDRRAWVWKKSINASTCRNPDCRRRIWWAELVTSRKRMCFDEEPVALAERTDGDGLTQVLVSLDQVHWATCPGAASFRKTRTA